MIVCSADVCGDALVGHDAPVACLCDPIEAHRRIEALTGFSESNRAGDPRVAGAYEPLERVEYT